MSERVLNNRVKILLLTQSVTEELGDVDQRFADLLVDRGLLALTWQGHYVVDTIGIAPTANRPAYESPSDSPWISSEQMRQHISETPAYAIVPLTAFNESQDEARHAADLTVCGQLDSDILEPGGTYSICNRPLLTSQQQEQLVSKIKRIWHGASDPGLVFEVERDLSSAQSRDELRGMLGLSIPDYVGDPRFADLEPSLVVTPSNPLLASKAMSVEQGPMAAISVDVPAVAESSECAKVHHEVNPAEPTEDSTAWFQRVMGF